MYELFDSQIKKRKTDFLEHMKVNVSLFYKIPKQELIKKYKYSEIKEMYIDILYYNKEKKEALEEK